MEFNQLTMRQPLGINCRTLYSQELLCWTHKNILSKWVELDLTSDSTKAKN